MRQNHNHIFVGIVFSIFFVFALCLYFFELGGYQFGTYADIVYLVSIFISVVYGFLLVRVLGRDNPHAVSIAYLTFALACWGIGAMLFSFFDMNSVEIFPSIADYFYLLAYLLFFYATYLEIGSIKFTPKYKYYISHIVPPILFALLIIQAVVLGSYNPDFSIFQNIFINLYSIIDVFLIASIILTLFIVSYYRKHYTKQYFAMWLYIVLGLILNLIGNWLFSVYFAQYLGKQNWVLYADIFKIACNLLIAYGFMLAYRSAEVPSTSNKPISKKQSMFDAYYQRMKNYVSQNLNFYEVNQETRRIRFLKSFSIVGFLFFFSFGIINISMHSYAEGIPELVIGVFFVINSIAINYTKNAVLARYIVLILMLSTFALLLTLGGIANSGTFWVFIFPAVAFIMMGKRGGLIWMTYLYLFLISLIVLQHFHIIVIAFTNMEIIMLMAAMLLLSSFIYIYESVTEYTSARITEKNAKLLENNETIKKEIQNRRRIETELSKKLHETEKLNTLMIGRELRIAELKKQLEDEKKQYEK